MAGEKAARVAGGAVRARLPDGRWHWQQGPIDLVIAAEGETAVVQRACEAGWSRFESLLGELVQELPLLRQPLPLSRAPMGPVARCMVQACAPHVPAFITPMAAVAGAVADEIIGFFREPGVTRAYVNNGGDIAVHLVPGERYRIGVCAEAGGKTWKQPSLNGHVEITHAMPWRGVATSGWRGRSFSLGIADSVTVLARTAAQADAAATLIANAVNVDSTAVQRRPANEIKDDTDLGNRLVTVEVGRLDREEIAAALDRGAAVAQGMMRAGLIHDAVLFLQGESRSLGPGTQLPRLVA